MGFLKGIDLKQDVFGKFLTYHEFKKMTLITCYLDTSHDTRSLYQDNDGQYWLYDFHEVMNFEGGPDCIYEHYFKLDDKSQAEVYKGRDIVELKSNFHYAYIGPGTSIIITR